MSRVFLNKYEKKVLRRLRDGTGAGPFEVLNALQDKGAITVKADPLEGEFIVAVTDAGHKMLGGRPSDD